MLDEAARLVEPRQWDYDEDPETLREWAVLRRQEVARAYELREAAAKLRAAEAAAAAERRRVDRARAAVEREAERERLRREGRLYANEKRRPNRPARIEVDEGAWSEFRRSALGSGSGVGEAVGALVGAWFQLAHLDSPIHGTTPARGRLIFIRLLGVDDATWSQFRSVAAEVGLTAARALGLLVECAVDLE